MYFENCWPSRYFITVTILFVQTSKVCQNFKTLQSHNEFLPTTVFITTCCIYSLCSFCCQLSTGMRQKTLANWKVSRWPGCCPGSEAHSVFFASSSFLCTNLSPWNSNSVRGIRRKVALVSSWEFYFVWSLLFGIFYIPERK